MAKISPAIVALKLASLVIDNRLSGRTDKEIKENAKLLAPIMAAYGSWNPARPGQYFMRDGKPHLAEGFTRVAAALSLDYKEGHFVECEDNPALLRIACITSNTGKPISRYEQGRIYSQMSKGEDPATAKKGQEIAGPMTNADIAKQVGYSHVHVQDCITIFSETPEIAQLISDGKVSSNIVVLAKQHQPDDAKRLRYLKAAIKVALADGKETATKKHLESVRAEFAPLKVKPKTAPVVAPDPASVMPPEENPPAKDIVEDTRKGKAVTTETTTDATVTTVKSMADIGAPKEEKATKANNTPTTVAETTETKEPTDSELEEIEMDIVKWGEETDTICEDSSIRALAVTMFNRGAR